MSGSIQTGRSRLLLWAGHEIAERAPPSATHHLFGTDRAPQTFFSAEAMALVMVVEKRTSDSTKWLPKNRSIVAMPNAAAITMTRQVNTTTSGLIRVTTAMSASIAQTLQLRKRRRRFPPTSREEPEKIVE
jgi:hypothetical protein